MKNKAIRGYKVFNSDWSCIGFQYKVGKTYKYNGEIKICEEGFHFCKKMSACFQYYDFDSNNKFAEVIATGKIIEKRGKCCTDEITIIRELSWHEVLDLVNTGQENSGCNNSGDRNFGHYNSGDRNFGYYNSGNYNYGDQNSGYQNSGHCNSGDRNLGKRNSGSCNFGNFNSGNYNSGNRNSGDWNTSDYNSGCFNTGQHKIKMFNKDSDWTYNDWLKSCAHDILFDMPLPTTKWVSAIDMTEEEKKANPTYEIVGGYLKEQNNIELRQQWWDMLSDMGKIKIKSIPNFDAKIFKQCTGIDVEIDEKT